MLGDPSTPPGVQHRHRIVDTAGRIRHVIVVADTMTDPTGAVVGTHGFYVDITPAEDRDRERFSAAIAEIAENRATIEQAKGMLMAVYGIDADAAFGLLRWRSQESNVKLRLLADQVVHDFVEPPRTADARPLGLRQPAADGGQANPGRRVNFLRRYPLLSFWVLAYAVTWLLDPDDPRRRARILPVQSYPVSTRCLPWPSV